MYTLQLLGGIGLADPSHDEVHALLRQPKHFAVLAFLALPKVGTWHTRDSVIATFWPELEQAKARAALRSALYTIRRHLPTEIVVSRGDHGLSLDHALITSDVDTMSDAVTAGLYGDAIKLYRGDLLPELYVGDSPEFEKWVHSERTRIRSIARKAASLSADQLASAGDLKGAIEAAQLGSQLEPNDEAAARKWIALLDRAGDRSQAFAVYEHFRNQMWEAFGVRPSAETVGLLESIRTRRDPSSPPEHDRSVPATSSANSPATSSATPPATSFANHSTVVAAPAGSSGSRRSWWIAAPLLAGVATLIGIGVTRRGEAAASAPRSLVVLPMVNTTGDDQIAAIASGIGEGVAKRLEGIGGLKIRSGARATWHAETRAEQQEIARRLGATILLKSSIGKVGDSLIATISVIDAASGEEQGLGSHRFTPNGTADVESLLAADVAGAVFRVATPENARPPRRAINPASYRLMLEGWYQMLNMQSFAVPKGLPTRRQRAAQLFTEAVRIDPLNAHAWAGLSSAWVGQLVTDAVPFDEGYQRATAAADRALAIDSMEGSALATLGVANALAQRDVAAGVAFFRKAEAADPSNPEIFMAQSVIFLHAHRYDEARDKIRIARELDPLSAYYEDHEATIEFCGGRAEAALRVEQQELAINPTNRLAQAGLTRALAMLGRYDEAIASWRKEGTLASDSVLLGRLANVHGRSGYFAARHKGGLERLTALRKKPGRVPPVQLLRAAFAAGDSATGFNALRTASEERVRALYRITCVNDVDEFRETPHFKNEMARIGPMSLKNQGKTLD